MQRSAPILFAIAFLGIGTASADEAGPPAEPRPAPPDQVSGVSHPEATPPSHELFWIPRALLFVPRWAFWVAVQPIRLGAWAYERYHIDSRFRGGLFAVDRPFSIYPTVRIDSSFGISAGARIVHKDLAGRGERLKLRADFSGRYRRTIGATLGSGDRFGRRFTAELGARYERRPVERFFGIGDLPVLDALPPMPIDPGTAAVQTRFREDRARAFLVGGLRIAGPLAARLSATLTRRTFGDPEVGADDPGVEAAYDTSRLAGWDGGVDNLYVEGELAYDSRRPGSIYQAGLDATGWYASAYLAGARGVAGDPTEYFRYGAEALRLLDLYRGCRILSLRVLAESIGGSDGRTDGKISFAELPRLGGTARLRGYPTGRFRDRALVLGTAEYTWDLGRYLAAYLFVDAGRVLPSLADFAPGERLRVGYGGGVQVHTSESFLGRVQVAASRDGNLELELVLSPIFGRRDRPGARR